MYIKCLSCVQSAGSGSKGLACNLVRTSYDGCHFISMSIAIKRLRQNIPFQISLAIYWYHQTIMYSVPEESKKVFQQGILENSTIIPNLPKDFRDHAKKIRFEGGNAPTMPINWRFAESISSIKALEATVLLALLKRKYDVEPREVIINTWVVLKPFLLHYSNTTPIPKLTPNSSISHHILQWVHGFMGSWKDMKFEYNDIHPIFICIL